MINRYKAKSYATLLLFLFVLPLKAQVRQNVKKEVKLPDLPGYHTLKCDFHMHTVFSDGHVWPSFRVNEALRDGLDAISITEHIDYEGFPDEIKKDYNKTYELATAAAKNKNLLVIPGIEISPRVPPYHHNALFVKDANKYPSDYMKNSKKEFVMKADLTHGQLMAPFLEAKKQQAFVFYNHPSYSWWDKKDTTVFTAFHHELLNKGIMAGVEVVNSGVYNTDGTYTHSGAYTGIASYIEGNNESNQSNLFIRNTAGFVAKPWKDYLTLKGDFTYSHEGENERRTNNYINYSNGVGQTARFGRSLLRQFSNDKTYLASNLTLGFDRRFNKHDVKALVGYNVESSKYKIFNASRDGILLEDKPDFNLMDGLNYTINGGGNEWSYTGLFYRLNYAFNDRYLIELNGRYDGSSKFPANQRYGFFPSVSAGWRISEEAFMDWSDSWLDNFKIRGSFGSLGNGNVAPYRYLEQMSVSKTSVILDGTQKNYTQLPGVIPDGLTWERSTTFDIGVDFNMLKNRLALSFDWYDRKTQDMFTVGQPLPAVFGSAVPFGNYADLSTKGWELTLGWNDRSTLFGKPFSYGINGSLWDSKSVITRFNNPKGTLASTYYEGHQIGEIWGYQTEGFFQSDEEVANHPSQKFLQNSNNNVWLAGDLKFADLNGDGVINAGDNTIYNSGDRKIIGNNAARYQFGFTLSGRWNGIGVSAFFQGIAKRDWYFGQEAGLFWGPYNRPYGYQPVKMMGDMWSPETPDAYFPRYRGYTALNANRSLGAPQTRYLQDASYLRLKTLTVDYDIPTQWLKKIAVSKASIFVTGQNLFTLSGLFKHTENFDPEVMEAPVGDLTNGSGQGYAYPMLKTTTIGLNLTF